MFILAAALIVAGVALFVAAPLGIGLVGARARSFGDLQADRYEHERALAVQGLRELEFDREMGKLSGADYETMHKALEDRALTAMAALERSRLQIAKIASTKKPAAAIRPQAQRRPVPVPHHAPAADAGPALAVNPEPRPPQLSPSRRISFCPQCGTRAAPDSKFCAQCGIAIKSIAAATAWTE